MKEILDKVYRRIKDGTEILANKRKVIENQSSWTHPGLRFVWRQVTFVFKPWISTDWKTRFLCSQKKCSSSANTNNFITLYYQVHIIKYTLNIQMQIKYPKERWSSSRICRGKHSLLSFLFSPPISSFNNSPKQAKTTLLYHLRNQP